jgi:hypothetical protein
MAAHFQGIVEDVETRDARRAGSRRHVAGENAHRGGLACAVRAQKPQDFSFIYGKRYVIHGDYRAVGLGQILYFDQCILLRTKERTTPA